MSDCRCLHQQCHVITGNIDGILKFNLASGHAMGETEYNYPTTTIGGAVFKYLKALPDLSGKTVVDLPAGDGRASYFFQQKGAKVIALDLYPEFMQIKGVDAQYADMTERLPLDDAIADVLMCGEGIEHIADKPALLDEFNRVLKMDGELLLTTPSLSHMRARLSMFLLETDFWKRMPPTEIDQIWFSDKDHDKLYYGHLFLSGVHHLDTLCRIAGFEVVERKSTYISGTSVLLTIIFYPFLLLSTLYAYRKTLSKNKKQDQQLIRRVLWNHVKLNLSLKTLCHKHVFWILRKVKSSQQSILDLKKLTIAGG